jgi:hypothetical protein
MLILPAPKMMVPWGRKVHVVSLVYSLRIDCRADALQFKMEAHTDV